MAEFALGLTKTAVEGTLSRVKSAIEEEAKLKVQVQNDLLFITGEFQMMQSFLNVVNKERARNEVVRTWVRQLRDLAFDVEDCVDFVVHLDNNKSDWWWRVVPSCMAPPLPIDQAVAEIQRLKARVEDVSQRNTRYNLISDDSGSAEDHQFISATTAVAAAASASSTTSSALHILTEVWEAAGKKRRVNGDLKQLINSEGNSLQVISVWGSSTGADEAAAHLFKEAYNDLEIRQEFSIRVCVKLTHPFDPDNFLKSLLTQLYATASSYQPINFGTTEDHYRLINTGELMQLMRQQRYLVILEDVSSVVEWDVIRMYLPDTNNGSRIVVSTQHLGLAVSCTGKPYQVSELRRFSHGQSLCAIVNKIPGRHSDMSEFSWLLSCGGVISVWGRGISKSALVENVYTSITHKLKGFDDIIEFEKHSWVNVPVPFDVNVFSRRLLLSFHSDDFGANEIAVVGRMGDQGVIEWCRKFLREDNCLIVIDSLSSTYEWDLIKAIFLSEPTKSCILVIANSSFANVARHCVDHEEDRAFDIEDLEVDAVLHHLIKGCQYYGIGGKEASSRGRLFSNRLKEARIWINKFGHVVRKDQVYHIVNGLKYPGVVSLWGSAGAGKVPLVRSIYYSQMLIVRHQHDDIFSEIYREEFGELEFTRFCWVDVAHPFNLIDLSWRLLLDFYSDDLKAKENVALGMMYGQNPIQGCRMVLRQDTFVVINGLRSTHDWDLIRNALIPSETSKSCLVVITNEASVATHCADHNGRVFNIPGVEAEARFRPLIKECGYYGNEHEEASRFFSNRREEAVKWAKTFELVGRQSEAAAGLAQLFVHTIGCLSVWGIAGVGKSSLVRNVYCKTLLGLRQTYKLGNRSIEYHLLSEFTKFSWVDVPHPFNLMDFCWRLLLDFHSDDLDAKEKAAIDMMEGQNPIQECRKFLHQECLVVIDGLRSTQEWDLIRDALLPEPTKGCIIVIANEANVAKYCVEHEYQVVNAKGLEPDTAFHLFRKLAWGGKQQLTPDETKFSELTVAKCGGLPKVIAAIAEYAADEIAKIDLDYFTGVTLTGLSREIHDDFMGNLETNSIFHSLRGLFSWMQSYFDACSDSLKPCIFYLSVFPLCHNIRRRRLLRRWIAEGYTRDTSAGGTAEDNGEMLFAKLVESSIIVQQTLSSSKVMCQVNGFFHGYIISRPMEDNLVFTLEGHCSLNSQRTGQHLTVRSSWDRDETVFKSMDLSRLRSLTVFGEWKPFFIHTDINMGLLRVLDLEDTLGVTDDDLEQIGKLLLRLKFLSLRGCKDINRLPDSLGGLRQLQALDARHTKIATLPRAIIIKLVKLQYVRAGTTSVADRQTAAADNDGTSTHQPSAATAHCDDPSTSQPAGEDQTSSAISPWKSMSLDLVASCSQKLCGCRRLDVDNVVGGVEVAEGIGKLTALHTLGVVNVSSGAGGKAILKELKKLTQLRKLGVCGINRRNWHDLCSAISCHVHLESLSLQLLEEESGEFCLADISNPPRTLKSLKLYVGNGNTLYYTSPVWMKQLGSLRKVHIEEVELRISTQEDIDCLMEVPCRDMFRHLRVRPTRDGELRYGRSEGYWHGGFLTKATVLNIDCSSYKLSIAFGDWIPTYVEVLVVHCSSAATGLSLEVSGLHNLGRLREVWLKGSYSEAVKQHLQRKLAEHWNNPVLKELDEQRSPKPEGPTPSAC